MLVLAKSVFLATRHYYYQVPVEREPPIDPDLLMGILVALLIICVVGFVLWICFLMTLQSTLALCHPDTRRMSPGEVWLTLIPVFGYIWAFVVVSRLADSLAEEYLDRGLRKQGDFGNGLGMTGLIVNLFVGPLALPLWLMYWSKIAEFNRHLRNHNRKTREARKSAGPTSTEPRPSRPSVQDVADDDNPFRF